MSGPPRLFDQSARDAHRSRALRSPVPGADFLLRAVADDLADRLAAVRRDFALALDISPSPAVAARLLATGQVGTIVRMDRIAGTKPDIVADPEFLPFAPGSLDLVVSALTLHWVNDLPGTLAQIRRVLKPDGLLLAAFLGGETLTELRQSLTTAESELTGGASPRVAPFADLRAVGALLQRAGFALPVIDADRRIVRYDSALALMRDLRAMGATNALHERSRTSMSRSLLAGTAAVYAEIQRPRRARARHLRRDLAVGLGAAREPAEATASGERNDAPSRRARNDRTSRRRKGGRLAVEHFDRATLPFRRRDGAGGHGIDRRRCRAFRRARTNGDAAEQDAGDAEKRHDDRHEGNQPASLERPAPCVARQENVAMMGCHD